MSTRPSRPGGAGAEQAATTKESPSKVGLKEQRRNSSQIGTSTTSELRAFFIGFVLYDPKNIGVGKCKGRLSSLQSGMSEAWDTTRSLRIQIQIQIRRFALSKP